MIAPTTKLPWSHNLFYVNLFYVDSTAQSDTEAVERKDQIRKKERNYVVEQCSLYTKVVSV